jgi:hypothetical protein
LLQDVNSRLSDADLPAVSCRIPVNKSVRRRRRDSNRLSKVIGLPGYMEREATWAFYEYLGGTIRRGWPAVGFKRIPTWS